MGQGVKEGKGGRSVQREGVEAGKGMIVTAAKRQGKG
jgi:hypothetical protein